MSTQYHLPFVPYSASPLSLDGGSLHAVLDVSFDTVQTLNIGSQSTGLAPARSPSIP